MATRKRIVVGTVDAVVRVEVWNANTIVDDMIGTAEIKLADIEAMAGRSWQQVDTGALVEALFAQPNIKSAKLVRREEDIFELHAVQKFRYSELFVLFLFLLHVQIKNKLVYGYQYKYN